MALALHSALDMRFKSLLVVFGILASSSLALADHQRDGRRRGTSFGVRDNFDRDGYRDRYRDAYRQRTTWVALSSPRHLVRGDLIEVPSRQRFAQLRLQNQTGRTAVRAVIVVLDNGVRHRVNVGRVLVGNHDMVDIDLPGGARSIERVIVLGDSRGHGTYQLYAI